MIYPKPASVLFQLLAGLRMAFLSFAGAIFAAAILAFLLNVIVVNIFPPQTLQQRIASVAPYTFEAIVRNVELTRRGEVLLSLDTKSGPRDVTLVDVAPVPAETQQLAAWREHTARELKRQLSGQPIHAFTRGDPTLAHTPRIYALTPSGTCFNARLVEQGLLYVPFPRNHEINEHFRGLQREAQRRRVGMYAWLPAREFYIFANY